MGTVMIEGLMLIAAGAIGAIAVGFYSLHRMTLDDELPGERGDGDPS